jgi:DNA gyrase/topoisomerase IV subunit B
MVRQAHHKRGYVGYDSSVIPINFDSRDLTALVVRALVLYSLAEFQGGHATAIRVNVEGTTFSVADDGRGQAIHRLISGQPYLPFIYAHLDYPFADAEPGDVGQVQLQGIGMSLVNSFCSELSVVVRKREGTLRLRYEAARLVREEHDEHANDSTGTSVSGTINPQLQPVRTDLQQIQVWLRRVATAHPTLTLRLNSNDVSVSTP